MKVEFNVKYGKNVIEIPIPDKTAFTESNMTDLWGSRVTIYNDVPASEISGRAFERFVIDKCNIQGGFVDKSDGTIRSVANAKTVITKDIEHYKSPEDFYNMPESERSGFYTAQTGDFVVFGEVPDVVSTAIDFAELQDKYKNNGIKITSVSANIYGMAVDNITMTNA